MATEKTKTDVNAIDKALAAARARKAAKEGKSKEELLQDVENKKLDAEAKAAAAEEAKKAKELAQAARKAEREAKKAQREAEREIERAAKRAEREAKKAAREAEKATKKPAHMSKVEKAGEKLPAMDGDTKSIFDGLTKKLDAAQIAILTEHLKHQARVLATERALETKLTVGQVVKIVSGNAKYIGFNATVTKPQRIRCYVDIPDVAKNVYLFTSDVVPVAVEGEQPEQREDKTGTEG